MNNVLKTAFGAVAAVAVVGATAAAVMAWGNSGEARPTYTKEQINNGALDNAGPVLNSISDNGNIGTTELNFVHAREYTQNNRADSSDTWEPESLQVKDGGTYMIRLYVHNDNRWERDESKNAIAKDVRTAFYIPGDSGKEVQVDGLITSSNATPKEYWSYVRFTAKRNFHLEYISGSAQLFNNGIGKNGYKLPDSLVNTENGALIGFDAIDGKIPGCFEFSSYVSVRVKVVYDEPSILVEKVVRKSGEKGWQETVDAKVGDKVDFRIHYKNLSDLKAYNVSLVDSLPTNMKYIAGTTKLVNTTYPKGDVREDTLTTTGINIGDYNENGDGWIMYTAEVVDKDLACGKNQLVNWIKVTADNSGNTKVLQDSAEVYVEKKCDTPEPPKNICKIVDGKHYGKNGNVVSAEQYKKDCEKDVPTPTPNPVTPAPELPTTGPATVVSSVLGASAMTIAAGYYVASRKQLR